MFSPLEQFNTIIIAPMIVPITYINKDNAFLLDSLMFGYFFDFSIFNLLIPLFLLRVFFYFFLLYFKKHDVFYLVPKTIFQRFYEFLMIFIFNLIKQQLGSNY